MASIPRDSGLAQSRGIRDSGTGLDGLLVPNIFLNPTNLRKQLIDLCVIFHYVLHYAVMDTGVVVL